MGKQYFILSSLSVIKRFLKIFQMFKMNSQLRDLPFMFHTPTLSSYCMYMVSNPGQRFNRVTSSNLERSFSVKCCSTLLHKSRGGFISSGYEV